MIHLHVHTEYSILDGLGSAQKYAQRASELGMSALACTDHGNIDGLIKFQSECKKAGIKPILGCEAYIVPDRFKKEKETRYHITILIRNESGWKALCNMLSKANLEGFYKKPRIDYSLIRQYISSRQNDGLIFLTGCGISFLNDEQGRDLFLEMVDLKIPVFLEIMPHILPIQKEIHEIISELKSYAPLVATNDCHYVNEDDTKTHEVLLAIQTKRTWNDPDRFRFKTDGFYLKSKKEMMDSFEAQNFWTKKEYMKAISNTKRIADMIDFEIEKKEISIPAPPKFKGKSEAIIQRELEKLTWQGLKEIGLNEFQYDDYNNRIKYELSVIKKKEFAKYFLIVKDMIDWSKENGIPIGPGRGSVGGSLVAFALGITQVDPLEYNLIFERFINENRKDWPDIDIDVSDQKRDLVKAHLETVYGENNIAGISTFGRTKAKMVIRDVARVFGVDLDEVDDFAKGISYDIAEDGQVLKTYCEQDDNAKQFKKKYHRVVNHAIKLEGVVRQAGQHAAALILSPNALDESGRGVLLQRKNEKIVNWEMNDTEYLGLIKLDLLRLDTLSVLYGALDLIKENYGNSFFLVNGKHIFINKESTLMHESEYVCPINKSLPHVPLNDERVFSELSEGNTVGIFQWQTWAMTKLAKDLRPRNFNDMIAAIALVRPGPADSGVTEKYIERRHGELYEPSSSFEYDEITKDTFGLIVYQEQVMQFLNKIAGMTLTEAEEIRKILAKKQDVKKLEPYRKKFLEGVKKLDKITIQQGIDFWEDIKKHASYSFNKSHSTAYALLGYWCAWLKIHYSVEFICSALTYGREDQKESLLEEANRLNLEILAPKIDLSDSHHWVAKNGKLIAPFISIKGIGEKTAIECSKLKTKKRTGFFDMAPSISPSIDGILKSINAYDSSKLPNDQCANYFDFQFPDCNRPPIEVKRGIKYINKKVSKCEKCKLRDECKKPVLSEIGLTNAVILAEAPGWEEDRDGKNLIGKAGKLLWDEFGKYKLIRKLFHVMNTCKCYPGKRIKTPQQEHIEACSEWLKDELISLENPLVLALGNIPLFALTGEKGGITKKAGTTEYIPKYKIWVCWGMHPSSVLRNNSNREAFELGIENFVNLYKEHK
jgi:DNA polymerase-3 subunit alpha